MIETQIAESSALMSKAAAVKTLGSEKQSGKDNKKADPSRRFNKDSLWCMYCKKSRHTRERCCKHHGKPLTPTPNKNWSGRNGQPRGQGQAYVANIQQTGEDDSQEPSDELNKAEIEMKNLLGTLEKPSTVGTCTLVFSGISSFSHGPNVSDIASPGAWVIDSGATDHMTSSTLKFVSYTPCPSSRKITIADGSVTTVAGQGDIFINNSLTLKNVQHVPKLFTNLLSIRKLTKDSKCSVIFILLVVYFRSRARGG